MSEPEASTFLATKRQNFKINWKKIRLISFLNIILIIKISDRYAVVTGANKGIGFEICKQLASKGMLVVVTARDEQMGLESVQKLKEYSPSSSHLLIFHQLDVTDPASISSLADFVRTQFGKLDILVNNAAILGAVTDPDVFLTAVKLCGNDWPHGDHVDWDKIITAQPYEMAKECLNTNYYGAKRMSEAFVSLLRLSDSPRIVNVSSFLGKLELIPGEWIRGVLSDVESLTEKKVDELLNKFLQDLKEGSLEKQGWPTHTSAYDLSKAALNAYTRLQAQKYPAFLVNCVGPGFVKTGMNCNTGPSTPAEGAEKIVRVALLPHGGPSGIFFSNNEVSSF